jgi:hypothetical protein
LGVPVSHVAVIPSIYQPWTDRCLRGCELNTFVVDNTETNRGVAASWNLGIDEMERRGADWLIIVSAAIRFGPPGGLDFLAALDEHLDALAVEAAQGIGWHLIAINKRTFERIGRFDENFYPAYFEDIDFGRRMWIEFDQEQWPRTFADVSIAGTSHGVDLGGAVVNNGVLAKYYRWKWGGDKGYETHTKPFGKKPIYYWPAR